MVRKYDIVQVTAVFHFDNYWNPLILKTNITNTCQPDEVSQASKVRYNNRQTGCY